MSELHSNRAAEEYLCSLRALRNRINDLENDLNDCEADNKKYISNEGWTEAEYKFNSCIQFLEGRNLKIERIESEIGIFSLINDLRATDADSGLISFVTEYWNHFHTIIQILRQLIDKFHQQIYSKVLVILRDQLILPTSNQEFAKNYHHDITEKISSMEKLYNRLSALYLSYQTKLDSGEFAARSKLREHLEAGAADSLPIVYLPRDLVLKLRKLIALSYECLNRDEQYVADMTCAMLESRKQKRTVEMKLNQQKDMQLDKIKSVNLANLLLQRNQELLDSLDNEIEELQIQMVNKENALSATLVEKERDSDAIEFLNYTISSTKRNQRLLIKRQNLLKTKISLEKKLVEIKEDIQSMKQTQEEKVVRKQELAESIESEQSAFQETKKEMDNFSEIVFEAERDIKDIDNQLIDIEILHCVKTSPENLDEVHERPQSVKIARSLRNKITDRRLRRNAA